MNRYFLVSLIIPLIIVSGIDAAAKKTVAVVNFQNSSGSPSLNYLRTALPESVSGTLSSAKEIKIVEREQLGKVLREIELEQSGAVDAGAVSRAGKLSKADVILIGSFTGNAEKLSVTLKAVDVATGVVLESRQVTAALGEVLEQSGQAALMMAASIAGGKVGYVTVTTNPAECEVLIDGVLVGKSPVVDYKLGAGKHRLFIRKADLSEYDSEITVTSGEHNRINETLAPKRKPAQFFIGVAYYRQLPASAALQQGNLFAAMLGVSFGKLTADLTYALNTSWDHSYAFTGAFGTLTQSRNYQVNSYLIGISFEPFDSARYISPYIGIFGGYTRVSDYRLKGSDNTQDRLASFDLLQVGTKFGIEIMPKFLVSLFLEARYHWFPKNINRTVNVSQGILGDPTSTTSEINLSNISVGGGARLNF